MAAASPLPAGRASLFLLGWPGGRSLAEEGWTSKDFLTVGFRGKVVESLPRRKENLQWFHVPFALEKDPEGISLHAGSIRVFRVLFTQFMCVFLRVGDICSRAFSAIA